MTSRRTRIASALLGVILWGGGTLLLTACGAPNAPAFTNTEQTYLSAVHNPCQHPEVFTNVRQGDTSYCEFVWAGDDKTQASEGHEICAIEKGFPPGGIYDQPYSYLQSRHPNYSTIQINTQLIAAEQTLCRS